MLGATGFTIAAIAISLFAWSCQKTYRSVDIFRLQAFVVAFYLLAAAMILWAVVAACNDPVITTRLMLGTDALILAATASMVLVVVRSLSPLLIVPLGLLSALAIGYRAFGDPSTAYVHNSLLFFDLHGGMRMVVVGIFAFLWLPAAMYFAGLVTRDPLLARQRLTFQLYFVALVAIFGVFAKAQREGAIITLFVVITVLFATMAVFNLVLGKAHAKELKGQRRAAR